MFSFLISLGDYKTLYHTPNVIIATLTISVHCFWFFNMLGPRRIFFLSFSPHFLCSSTKRKKENMKIIPIFKNQEKLKLIPKHCEQYELCKWSSKIKVVILYMLSTERDKKKRKKVKENYYYFATKKNWKSKKQV